MSLCIAARSAALIQADRDVGLLSVRMIAPLVWGCALAFSAAAQQSPLPVDVIDRPAMDTLDRIGISNGLNKSPARPSTPQPGDSCLLPPLAFLTDPTVPAARLQIPTKAKKEYGEACAALVEKNTAKAEKHLHKAVQEYPKYSAARVTLGQLFASQQRADEARAACAQVATEDASYVPAYLCLADIAARVHDWNDVLKLSSRALEFDPTTDAVAYEYHAAANLNLHNLAEAEKSALRAVGMDVNHHEPRVYFVLAQIYEAKREPVNEAAQLREYLKYITSPDDIAMMKQQLAELEKQPGK